MHRLLAQFGAELVTGAGVLGLNPREPRRVSPPADHLALRRKQFTSSCPVLYHTREDCTSSAKSIGAE